MLYSSSILRLLAGVAVALIFLSAGPLWAEDAPEVPQSCAAEFKSFCPEEKTPKQGIQCLVKNFAQLSTTCQQEIKRFGRAVEQAQDQAQGSLVTPSTLASQSPPFTVIALDGRYSPRDNSQTDGKLNISTPLLQTPEEYVAVSIAGSSLQFEDDLVLSSGIQAPSRLNRAETGLQYTKKMPGFKSWGLRGSVGSASDQLFKNSKDTTFSLIANYGYPTATGGFWMWTVFLSNNSPLGNYIPIPGVIYIKRSPTFTGMFGFPTLSLQWTPTADTAYSFSMLGTSLSTEAAFGEIQKQQTYATLKWTNQGFLPAERSREKDRLTFEEKKLGLGLRKFYFGNTLIETEAGHAFDRLIYLGEGLRNMGRGSKDISANWYFAINIKAGF